MGGSDRAEPEPGSVSNVCLSNHQFDNPNRCLGPVWLQNIISLFSRTLTSSDSTEPSEPGDSGPNRRVLIQAGIFTSPTLNAESEPHFVLMQIKSHQQTACRKTNWIRTGPGAASHQNKPLQMGSSGSPGSWSRPIWKQNHFSNWASEGSAARQTQCTCSDWAVLEAQPLRLILLPPLPESQIYSAKTSPTSRTSTTHTAGTFSLGLVKVDMLRVGLSRTNGDEVNKTVKMSASQREYLTCCR